MTSAASDHLPAGWKLPSALMIFARRLNGANSAVGNTTFVGNDPDDGAPATPDPTDTSPVTDRPHKTISGDILAGDSDVDGPGPLTVTPGTFATNDGGTVTIESDGD